MKEEKIKEILLQQDEDFKKIFLEHQQCEQALSELWAKSFLSEEDKLREKQLKKKKLKLKDEMYRMIIQFERQTEGHE